MENNTIKVSVICLTYNHEKHIARALDGFVNQKTNFDFEVLVHDDCSTDGTAEIIRDYAQRYPDIIKPILQTVNQYSQGIWIDRDIVAPLAKGRYVAYCEGDDYWSDPNKLQKQYDFLSANPSYSACAHKTVFHNMGTGEDYLVPSIKKDRDYSLEEITMVGGSLFGTNSFMVRRELVVDMPDCFLMSGFSDFQLFMYAAMNGKVRCLNAAMSVYNIGVAGSWTQTMMEDKQRRIHHCQVFIKLLDQIDEYFAGKYHNLLNKKRREMEYLILAIEEDCKGMRKPEYFPFYLRDAVASAKGKLATAFPVLRKIKRWIKGRYNNGKN